MGLLLTPSLGALPLASMLDQIDITGSPQIVTKTYYGLQMSAAVAAVAPHMRFRCERRTRENS